MCVIFLAKNVIIFENLVPMALGVIVGQNAGHGADYLGSSGSYNIEIDSLFKKTGVGSLRY